MATIEQVEYTHKCLNRLLQIEEEIYYLDKQRDRERIQALRKESLKIQIEADRHLLSSIS